MLRKETVSPELLKVLLELMKVDFLKKFRLVGGTALSLQLGHRSSIDIDLFTDKAFNKEQLVNDMKERFKVFPSRNDLSTGAAFDFNGIKVDIFNWGVPFLKPAHVIEGIRLSSTEDIAAMKFEAVITRGVKKDYWDIAELLDKHTINEMVHFFKMKYFNADHRQVLDNLQMFERADNDIDPKSYHGQTWQSVKEKISKALKKYIAEQFQ